MNTEIIYDFISEKLFAQLNPTIPLIFFSNSDERDLIEISSKLSQFQFPELDDDSIYVYALADKALSLLSYQINYTKEYLHNKPIFLFLHVPDKYEALIEKDDDIEFIILKISYFLSLICDFEIVILNKEYYFDQLKFIKRIQNIHHSYDIGIQRSLSSKSVSYITFGKNTGSNENNEYSSDGDCFDDYEEQNKNEINKSSMMNDPKSLNGLFNIMTMNMLRKELKHIVLVNDERIRVNIEEKFKSPTFNIIREKQNQDNLHIHYINIHQPTTYKSFLTTFCNHCLKARSNYENLLDCFDMYPITEVSKMYLRIKGQDDWKTELRNELFDRFRKLKAEYTFESNDFMIFSCLKEEISQLYPSIDSEFDAECNVIISDFSENSYKKKHLTIEKELRESADNNLRYLETIINKRLRITETEIDIKGQHIEFLENEFFNIISALYPKKEAVNVLLSNHDILDKMIQEDTKKIQEMIAKHINKIESKYDYKTVQLLDKNNVGTNYTIKEKINIKEIEVMAATGSLTDVIDQDF